MIFVGLLIAADGYWLIHYWREDLLDHQHNIFGCCSRPRCTPTCWWPGWGWVW